MISVSEAAAYLGFRDIRTVKKRCPKTFYKGCGTVETFAKELCENKTKGGNWK